MDDHVPGMEGIQEVLDEIKYQGHQALFVVGDVEYLLRRVQELEDLAKYLRSVSDDDIEALLKHLKEMEEEEE